MNPSHHFALFNQHLSWLNRVRWWFHRERKGCIYNIWVTEREREREMDYKLAALKVLCGNLKNAKQTSSQSGMILDGILFQRAWLQGILVSSSKEGYFVLDDGTGVIELFISGEFLQREWKIGMYVMVVGVYFVPTNDPPLIKESRKVWFGKIIYAEFNQSKEVQKMVDLSPFPDREAMWHLEVIEAYKMFYQPSIEE